jgi:hypothetical protein
MGFHYIGPIIYPDGLTRSAQYLALVVLIAVNLIGYSLVWRRRRRHPGRSSAVH